MNIENYYSNKKACYAFIKNNKINIMVCENSIIRINQHDSNLDVLNTINIPIILPNNLQIIPSYCYFNTDYLTFATGISYKGRYAIASINTYNLNNIGIPDILDISSKKLTTINSNAKGLTINNTGDRICFVNFTLFYIEQINKYVPRYAVSVYDKQDNNEWFEFGTLLGSLIDPTYIEALQDLLSDENKINRKLRAESTGEYRNIDLSDDGIYASMWTPFIKIDDDIIIIKPFYEPITSFVRIDSISNVNFNK
jgi:hypothetical protein